MSHIVIGCGAMSFGPNTLKFKSLGGSETAALMLGKALAARGHRVIMFCNMPDQGQPDFAQPGVKAEDGVVYVPLGSFGEYTAMTPHDLLIAVRDPQLCATNAQAKKKVLWMHDIATKRGMQRAFDQMSFLIDEVWTVSEWHRKQVAEVTGYSIDHIVALRNGIVPVEVPPLLRSDKQLVYAARPERGLDNLIRPGGIMDQLPEYNLKVAMYAHFPEHMRAYYEGIFKRMQEMPNVEYIGALTQEQLRAVIAESAAYIYPTQFEETSCILARECIEQGTPMLTTREGALPETLGNCGVFFEDWAADFYAEGPYPSTKGDQFWCEAFARFVREELTASRCWVESAVSNMAKRTDLYWDGVAELVEANLRPRPVKPFSHLYSLMQNSDIVPALAWVKHHLSILNTLSVSDKSLDGLREELEFYRPIIEGDIQKFYEDEVYRAKSDTPNTELVFRFDYDQSMRWKMIREEIAALPPGSIVVEYGCGPGHVLAPLARDFPQINFVGYDLSQSAVDVVNAGADKHGLKNIQAIVVGDDPHPTTPQFDAAICTEMLEHTVRPWEYVTKVESLVKPGGRVIFTTPQGNWETISHRKPGQWKVREHIWHIDREMMLEMTGEKQRPNWRNLVMANDAWGRCIGHMFYAYDADHVPAKSIDPLVKALRHWPRQSVAAAIIAYNNEDTILRMLNSLKDQVQFIQIALGPATDHTREIVERWFSENPYIRYRILDVPKIEAYKFGFDDARNSSVKDLYEWFDWVLWIDTDEYLSGDVRQYLRNNQLDGYLIAQHHFTVEPRGKPPEIDRPARLMRATSNFVAQGHIHEHFEVPEGGPGRCYMLPNVDIGHPGYVNESTRRERFKRNYPFLEWDHADHAKKPRKLHHFLWLRDIIHRMRFEPDKAYQLAEEAVAYYNAHREDMAAFGPGLSQALRYLSEANQVLGKGVPVKLTVALDDRGTDLAGQFDSYEQLEAALAQILKPEFENRLSRYW